MRRRGGFLLLNLVMTLLLALGLGPSDVRAKAKKVRVGQPPPDLIWSTADGDSLRWQEIGTDQPVVMVFWATWCSVCKKEWPRLQELAESYRSAPRPPRWASVSLGDPVSKVVAELKKRGDLGLALADPQELNGKVLGIKYVPLICVLDSAGDVAYYGAPKLKKLRRLLDDLTAANPD